MCFAMARLGIRIVQLRSLTQGTIAADLLFTSLFDEVNTVAAWRCVWEPLHPEKLGMLFSKASDLQTVEDDLTESFGVKACTPHELGWRVGVKGNVLAAWKRLMNVDALHTALKPLMDLVRRRGGDLEILIKALIDRTSPAITQMCGLTGHLQHEMQGTTDSCSTDWSSLVLLDGNCWQQELSLGRLGWRYNHVTSECRTAAICRLWHPGGKDGVGIFIG